MSDTSVVRVGKRIGTGLWAILALVRCIRTALGGFGLLAVLADVMLGLGATMLGITVWEHFRPRSKRRRSQESQG
ncbi:hypothetical protein [Streptacidiphilus sp. PAMC 29251]